MTKDQVFTLMESLLKREDVSPVEVPGIVSELIEIHNSSESTYKPLPLPTHPTKPKSKRIGWPMGVSRNEYLAWKAEQLKAGRTNNLNPYYYGKLVERGKVKNPRISVSSLLAEKATVNH